MANKKKTAKKQEVHYEKALFIQRLAAYILDIMIISVIVSLFSYPFLDNESIQKLDNQAMEVAEEYVAGDIESSDYISESISISYELARKNGVVTLITVFLNILYFIIYQLRKGGQTLGKMVMRIKVVSVDGGELGVNQMTFRSLIINSILVDMISFAILLFANDTVYFYGVGTLSMIQSVIIFASALMFMFGAKRQGIHDLVAHTEVVRTDLVKEMEVCEN